MSKTRILEEYALKYYKTLSLKELRRRQSLCEQQIKRAFDQRNDEALGKLQKTDLLLQQAVMEQYCPD
jgi:hypothetical protein